jgi:hypothetical protein
VTQDNLPLEPLAGTDSMTLIAYYIQRMNAHRTAGRYADAVEFGQAAIQEMKTLVGQMVALKDPDGE